MPRPVRPRSVRPSKAERQSAPNSWRDRLAVLLALVAVVGLGAAFFLARDTQFLMPGPLTSAHGTIENCSACHTESGRGKLSWVHGLVAGDPRADSRACLGCHKMPDTAFNPHGASTGVLRQSTRRLTRIATATPAPLSARAQSIAFPTDAVVAGGLDCATCHQEHKGVNFNLNKISNEQCRSCHVVKFDSFDGHHPKFDNYPFKRRTRIVYDHVGHARHFSEVAKKYPSRRIPATCSTCHDSRADRRIMAVAPFEQTCSACHLNQITGEERVSGPKGIAFLALPGLDLQTLKEKKAVIGEWPAASVAELTPFMKVMIGRNERGRALIEIVDSLDLQDLTHASDDQIEAVTNLVWEIKRLFYALISGKASDVLGNLNIGGNAKLSAKLVADLTANIPRDVVVSAHRQWLPNLGTEMANRQDLEQSGRITRVRGWIGTRTQSRLAVDSQAGSVARPRRLAQAEIEDAPGAGAKSWQINPYGRPIEDEPEAVQPRAVQPRPVQPRAVQPRPVQPRAVQPRAVQPKAAANARPDDGSKTLSSNERPRGKATEQTDDLLFPTEEELRGIGAPIEGPAKAAQPEGAGRRPATANANPRSGVSADAVSKEAANAPAKAPAASDAAAPAPRAKAVPVISIESNVDPESWAEYGGWYRQDYTIFYRPTGHKDKFIYSWLVLTGPQAPKGDTSPAAAVFDFLTSKNAQGACTKCHSVDNIRGGGRVVNFSPASIGTKQGRFTTFIHEPHFGILENRGCLTCHSLERGRRYLQSYKQSNPKNFVSNFGAVKKELCQTCHTRGMARQDCLLCHKYHVNGVITPIMNTRIPTE